MHIEPCEPSFVKSMKVVLNERPTQALLKGWEETPDHPDAVRLTLECEAGVYTAYSDRSYFRALAALREQLECVGGKILCFGACRQVYPSSFIENMGNAEKAYMLTMGKRALNKDLVDIFDFAEGLDIASVAEQDDFYNRWFDSIT